ncbi:MAG: hypothetical protein AVDCRST_MAG11-3731, partial [uncultured Gemmatimonadaceae bacterium]
ETHRRARRRRRPRRALRPRRARVARRRAAARGVPHPAPGEGVQRVGDRRLARAAAGDHLRRARPEQRPPHPPARLAGDLRLRDDRRRAHARRGGGRVHPARGARRGGNTARPGGERHRAPAGRHARAGGRGAQRRRDL